MGLILFLIGGLFAQTMNESLIIGDRADLPTDSVFFVNSKKGAILSRLTNAEKLLLNPTAGMIIYNLDKFQYEQFNGTAWIRLGSGLLDDWQSGQSYVVGEIKNSGSDGNWLFKVIKDHVSSYVPTDLANGNLLAISPPIITTGVQDGGEATLVVDVATVQAGTGFIARYNLSPSPYPLITIVEWPTQTITLPASGIFALLIDPNGTLIYTSGVSQKDITTDNIGVAIVDMNLGSIFDRKTYPTNPVGQLKNLAYFFGGMTKGLKYSATGLQLGRSEHDIYFWGANFEDPYSPNTKTAPPINPVTFFEFTQNGPVAPVIQKTTLRNNVYDLNGTLVTMSNNKWGFIRIFSSLGVDDYIMYSQAEYPTESDAKEAAMSGSFIKPQDLALTKFSAWLVFEKGDADFSNNEIIICEPFGCDKVGSAGGGGTGGIGDVAGPASSVDSALAAFSGTSGKVLKSSNQLSLGSILVLDKEGVNDGQLNISSAIAGSGKYGVNKFIFQNTNLETFTLQAPAITTSYVLSLPLVGPSNDQILKSDGNGQLSWTALPGASSGNVVGPGSSVANEFAKFDDITGKLISSTSGISYLASSNNVSQYIKGKAGSGYGDLYVQNFPLQSTVRLTSDSTGSLIRLFSSGAGTPQIQINSQSAVGEITLGSTAGAVSNWLNWSTSTGTLHVGNKAGQKSYYIYWPTEIPTAAGKILGIVSKNSTQHDLGWIDLPVSPTPTVVEDLLTSTSGVNALSANQGRILDGKITQNISDITSNTILITENQNDIDILFSDIADLQSSSHSHANKTLLDSLISNGSATQFLSADGTYQTPVDNVGGTGDVIGPGSATDNAVVRFDTGSGKLIKNSGVLIDASNNITTPGTVSSVGQIWSTVVAKINFELAFDFNGGNNQHTNANCAGITLSNMQDGGVYSIVVKGGAGGTCSFSHAGLTMHYPLGHGPATSGKHTLYTFTRMGLDVYIGWSPGI